jgi:hypothetical protein
MVQIGPWPKGINNRSADYALPNDVARNLVNIDINNLGNGKRRKGCTRVYSGLFPKGGFSCPAGEYFIEQGKIKKFNINNTATVIFKEIIGTEYTWTYLNNTIYFSDGNISLKIINDVVSKWGMLIPSSPSIHSTPGTYGSGQYLAAVCWVDANGVESGASLITSVILQDNTGVIFSNLPISIDPQVVALRLYLSMPNGSELYHIANVNLGTIDYTITVGRYDDSNILEHTQVSPAPAGRIIRFHNGRAFVADEFGYVWYSDPLEFDHFRLGDNFLLFPQKVDIMEPVAGGIFFCYGDKTEFYSGDVEDGFTIIPLVDYGGIYGTGKSIPNSANVCWQSQRGMCIGTPDGNMKNIVEENVATETATKGTTLIKEKDGLRQFIASLHQTTPSPLAATSWIEAEIIRRG